MTISVMEGLLSNGYQPTYGTYLDTLAAVPSRSLAVTKRALACSN